MSNCPICLRPLDEKTTMIKCDCAIWPNYVAITPHLKDKVLPAGTEICTSHVMRLKPQQNH